MTSKAWMIWCGVGAVVLVVLFAFDAALGGERARSSRGPGGSSQDPETRASVPVDSGAVVRQPINSSGWVVSGEIRDVAGGAIVGATVVIGWPDAGGRLLEESSASGADGAFAVPVRVESWPRVLRMTVSARGYRQKVAMLRPSAIDGKELQVGVTYLEAGAEVVGVVVGESGPVAGVKIKLRGGQDSDVECVSGNSGEFVAIGCALTGEYTVQVLSLTHVAADPAPQYVRAGDRGVRVLVVRLDGVPSIEGVVIGADRQPVMGASVVMRGEGEFAGRRAIRTGEDGEFVFHASSARPNTAEVIEIVLPELAPGRRTLARWGDRSVVIELVPVATVRIRPIDSATGRAVKNSGVMREPLGVRLVGQGGASQVQLDPMIDEGGVIECDLARVRKGVVVWSSGRDYCPVLIPRAAGEHSGGEVVVRMDRLVPVGLRVDPVGAVADWGVVIIDSGTRLVVHTSEVDSETVLVPPNKPYRAHLLGPEGGAAFEVDCGAGESVVFELDVVTVSGRVVVRGAVGDQRYGVEIVAGGSGARRVVGQTRLSVDGGFTCQAVVRRGRDGDGMGIEMDVGGVIKRLGESGGDSASLIVELVNVAMELPYDIGRAKGEIVLRPLEVAVLGQVAVAADDNLWFDLYPGRYAATLSVLRGGNPQYWTATLEVARSGRQPVDWERRE